MRPKTKYFFDGKYKEDISITWSVCIWLMFSTWVSSISGLLDDWQHNIQPVETCHDSSQKFTFGDYPNLRSNSSKLGQFKARDACTSLLHYCWLSWSIVHGCPSGLPVVAAHTSDRTVCTDDCFPRTPQGLPLQAFPPITVLQLCISVQWQLPLLET